MRFHLFLILLFTACAHGGASLNPLPQSENLPSSESPGQPLTAAAPGGCRADSAAACPTPSAPEKAEPRKEGAEQGATSRSIEAEPNDGAHTERERVVAVARQYLGKRFRGDCSTFVRRVYSEAGLPIAPAPATTASEGLYLTLQSVDRPKPGDLAFFHDTYGRPRGPGKHQRVTHVAVVEAVQGAVIWLIHRGARGIARIRLDLEKRHDRDANSRIRFHRRGDRPGIRYLSGELLSGFGALPGLATAVR